MNEKYSFKKGVLITIIFFLISASVAPSTLSYSEKADSKNNFNDEIKSDENVLISCSTYGTREIKSKELNIPSSEAEMLLEKLNRLAYDSSSADSEQLQQEVITIAKEYNLIPKDTSLENLKPSFVSSLSAENPKKVIMPTTGIRGTAALCNFATTGEGSQFPIIILPRLIPILLIPIPRLFLHWSSLDGYTSCGSYLTGTGFIAGGKQTGTAIGFWGIGFSIFLPPVMAYGFFGYALFATCTAEIMEPWPPNYAPEVSPVFPQNGATNVPISISELSFRISDENGDKMEYTVTTDPDIGSGSGSKKDGTYSIPISGLEGSEEYMWKVEVSDGQKYTVETFKFSTEEVAPIVYDPNPKNSERYVPINLGIISFKLKDSQGDLMDYTVETVPDIGSGNGSGVSDGTYSIEINDLDYSQEYRWFVNVTDGVNWKHKDFSFQAEHKMVFNPFEEGWQYRKKITIDHTKVSGDLVNFPVLISTTDSDLRDKAQSDGDDILFMNNMGVATRLYHEIEYYDETSGELIAWVNVSNIKSYQDTDFYMYYCNPDFCNNQAPEKVWSSDFISVLHMSDYPDNYHIIDSTNYDNDGIKKGCDEPIETNGKIGKSQAFDGSNDYIDTKDFDIDDDFTISIWINPSSTEYNQCFIGKHKSGIDENILVFGYYHDNSGLPSGYSFHIRGERYRGGIINTGWHEMVYVGEKISSSVTKATVYKNGELLWQHNLSKVAGNILGRPWAIGQDWDSVRTDFFNGIIDEVRIANNIKSPDWILTEYNNQNDSSSFLSFGPEEADV